MALTVRLSPKAERALNAAARRRRMSRSDIVREALEHYEASDRREHVGPGPYEAWGDVIGVVKLGVRQPTRTTGEQFTAILRGQVRAPHAR